MHLQARANQKQEVHCSWSQSTSSPAQNIKNYADPESVTSQFFFYSHTPPLPITSPPWASCPHILLDGSWGMTLDGLRLVELIIRTQQGENQQDRRMRQYEKCFVRDKWQTRRSLCNLVQPLLPNKASAFLSPAFICLPSLTPSSAKGSIPDSSWLSDCKPGLLLCPRLFHLTVSPLIKGTHFKIYTLLPFDIDSTNTL